MSLDIEQQGEPPVASAAAAITLRKARPLDAGFIGPLFEEDRRSGHYKGLGSSSQEMIARLIRDRSFYVQYSRGVMAVQAEFLIIECDGRPVGFAALRFDETLPAGGVELWCFSVAKDARGQGIGRKALDELCRARRQIPGCRDICARCLPASDGMIRLLKRAGFHQANRTPEWTGWMLSW